MVVVTDVAQDLTLLTLHFVECFLFRPMEAALVLVDVLPPWWLLLMVTAFPVKPRPRSLPLSQPPSLQLSLRLFLQRSQLLKLCSPVWWARPLALNAIVIPLPVLVAKTPKFSTRMAFAATPALKAFLPLEVATLIWSA